MSEKLKPNFTPVPNVIFDKVMRTLAPGAVKVLFAICRYTYGWGKKSDRISLNQLSDMTGMDRANVSRSVRQLSYLVSITPGDRRINQASEYRINVDISDSDLVSQAQQGLVSNQQQASVRPSVKTTTIQRNPKKEDIAASKKRSQRTPKSKDPRVKEFIDWFADSYTKRFKEPYHVKGGKDGQLVKSLLCTFDLAELQRRTGRLWDSQDKFISGTDRGIGILASQVNKLSGTNTPGARPRGLQEIPLP